MPGLLRTEDRAVELLYLSRADVIRCCDQLDVVDIVRRTLVAHAEGRTLLPPEAYLGWRTSEGYPARCLAMPGGVLTGGGPPLLGLKMINASLANTARGLPRSQGFTALFDPETSRPVMLMEAAYVSALRTAAVTAATARHLVPQAGTLALLGCGTLARAHLDLLPGALPALGEVRLYDSAPGRADALAAALRADPDAAGLGVVRAADPQDCVRGADLVVPLTTTTEGYLEYDWLAPGALLAHVSLDDALPEIVHRAQVVLVDDWHLVSDDPRRLLGRMYRSGTLLGPDGERHPDAAPVPGARRVDGTLGGLLTGAVPRPDGAGVVLSNPFGMAVLDVAVAGAVYATALAAGTGRLLRT